MRSFLKENLTIEVVAKEEWDYNDQSYIVNVKLRLGEDVICESSDSIYVSGNNKE